MGIKICPDCGGKVSDTRMECPHCGYSFGTVNNGPQYVKVVVEREKSLVFYAITTLVCVDGQQYGSLNAGESCTFMITPGYHNFSIGRGVNGPITTNLVDGTKQINVGKEGTLYIRFVVRTKLAMGFYVDITSVTQK